MYVVEWKRVLDMNDRALRHVNVGLGGPTNGVPREDGFNITVVFRSNGNLMFSS